MTRSESAAVRVELDFLDPRFTLRRQFIAPGARIATARTGRHPVTARDGRPVQQSFELDVHGLEIVDHRSAVTDFTDPAQLEACYVAEVCRLVQEKLGAEQVLSRGWELRRSVAPAEHGAQPPAGGVHVDYAPDHVPSIRCPDSSSTAVRWATCERREPDSLGPWNAAPSSRRPTKGRST